MVQDPITARNWHPELPGHVIPVQRPGFELRSIPCCHLLQDAERRTVLKLNDTAVLIWQLCVGEWTVGEILDALTEQYPEVGSMANDVFRTLDLLVEERVIELRNE